MIFERFIEFLRRINRWVALVVGAVLMATVIFIIVDVLMRKLGRSLGGSDEISGYVMAVLASWGLAYGLLELAHVRIDVIRLRLSSTGRIALDLFAFAVLTITVCITSFQTWSVLGKSLERGSRANTPLGTPLWIPQSIWFSGWVWFALMAILLLVCAIGILVTRQTQSFNRFYGTVSEVEEFQ